MSEPTKQDEERIMFFITIECLCQQVEMLETPEKQQGKIWLSKLIDTSRRMMKELRKEMAPETVVQFDDMCAYFYAIFREASKVHTEDADEFHTLVSEWVKKKYPNEESSIFKPKPIYNDQD